MQEKNDKNDMRAYRTGSFTVLQWMAILALTGVVVTWLLQHFFAK